MPDSDYGGSRLCSRDGMHAILMTGARCLGRAQTKARWQRDFGSAFAQGMHWEPVSAPPRLPVELCACGGEGIQLK